MIFVSPGLVSPGLVSPSLPVSCLSSLKVLRFSGSPVLVCIRERSTSMTASFSVIGVHASAAGVHLLR